MLTIRGLTKNFGGLRAVNNLDLSVEAGEIVGLIGPNGSGKTTVFNLVTGLVRPTVGDIFFLGKPIVGLAPERITQAGIARTFQNLRIFGRMSVLENVLVGTYPRTRSGLLRILARSPSERQEDQWAKELAIELLSLFGRRLSERIHDPASSLSYANRRRLEIARALATVPKLILLDEPTAGMNPTETHELMDVVRRIRDRGVTILLIEHDLTVIKGICRRVIVLDHGVAITQGSYDEIRNNEAVIEAYLGRADDAAGT